MEVDPERCAIVGCEFLAYFPVLAFCRNRAVRPLAEETGYE